MMKKTAAGLLAALMMSVALVGCGGGSTSTSSSTSASESTSTSASVSESKSGEIQTVGGDEIVMATNAAFPPFEYMSNNEIAGVDVDIAKEIAKDMGKTLRIDNMEFDAIIPAVKNGQADFGAAGMTIKPERQEQVDFSVEYVKSAQYVIIPKGSGITAKDLGDKKIGVQRGTTGDFYATDDIKGDPNTEEVLRYTNAIVAAQDLMNGKCDVIIIDKLPAESIVEQNSDTLELLPDALTEESYAIAVKKGNEELLTAIDDTLQRLLDEGKIDSYVVDHMENGQVDEE